METPALAAVGKRRCRAATTVGKRLCRCGRDRTVRLWQIDPHTLPASEGCRVLRGHSDEVFAIAFHPDGTRLATGGHDGAVWLWDLARGEELVRLPGTRASSGRWPSAAMARRWLPVAATPRSAFGTRHRSGSATRTGVRPRANDWKRSKPSSANLSASTNYIMTMAWPEGPFDFKAGAPITCRGMAVCGREGLKRVEYWLRPDSGTQGVLPADDPAWKTATWQPCDLAPPPNDWKAHLPDGIASKELWGFDPETGKPKEWPVRYSVAMWTAPLQDLKAGAYELRVRAVDQSGLAQPELPPKRDRAKGQNAIQCRIIKVT